TLNGGGASDPVNHDLSGFHTMRVEATLRGAANGTLNCYLQCTYDRGQSWTDLVAFTQQTASASATTYGVTLTRSNGSAYATSVGKGTSPALSAGTSRDGCWGDQVRILFVAGSGTTAGASQSFTFFLSS